MSVEREIILFTKFLHTYPFWLLNTIIVLFKAFLLIGFLIVFDKPFMLNCNFWTFLVEVPLLKDSCWNEFRKLFLMTCTCWEILVDVFLLTVLNWCVLTELSLLKFTSWTYVIEVSVMNAGFWRLDFSFWLLDFWQPALIPCIHNWIYRSVR